MKLSWRQISLRHLSGQSLWSISLQISLATHLESSSTISLLISRGRSLRSIFQYRHQFSPVCLSVWTPVVNLAAKVPCESLWKIYLLWKISHGQRSFSRGKSLVLISLLSSPPIIMFNLAVNFSWKISPWSVSLLSSLPTIVHGQSLGNGSSTSIIRREAFDDKSSSYSTIFLRSLHIYLFIRSPCAAKVNIVFNRLYNIQRKVVFSFLFSVPSRISRKGFLIFPPNPLR